MCDNCKSVANPEQTDDNQNFIGDACETGEDMDHDGFIGQGDNCPEDFNADQLDTDKDGVGDACSDDKDGDGIPDSEDNCPLVKNKNQEKSAELFKGIRVSSYYHLNFSSN